MVEDNRGEFNPSQNREGYNGWKNYQTWCIKVWLDNSEEVLWRFEQLAAQGITVYDLSDALYKYFNASNPLEDTSSPFNDLLNHALGEVEWSEIAHALYPTANSPSSQSDS